MRFDLDMGDSKANQIRAYDHEKIQINNDIFTQSIIVSPQVVIKWDLQEISKFSHQDLASLLELKPEVVLLGTGIQIQYPKQEILAAFLTKHIGVEIMTTAAACRTYDILMSEGRQVVAGLIINAKSAY